MKPNDLYGYILIYYKIFEPYIKERKKIEDIQRKQSLSVTRIHPLPTIRKEYGEVGIVSIISSSIKDKGYIMFSVYTTSVVYEMQKFLKLYKRDVCNNCAEFMCHISEQDVLFEKFSSDIYDIQAPNASIKSCFIESYIKANCSVLEHYMLRCLYCYDVLKKNGIWKSDSLYYSIVWTFDYVEKYKNLIDWKRLIELSNLEWDADKLAEYHNYIPSILPDGKFYCDRFASSLSNFSKVTIDSTYVINNFYSIDIIDCMKTAKITLNKGDISLLYNMLSNIKDYWSSSFPNTLASGQLQSNFYHALARNKNIQWTPELLLEMGAECEKFLKVDNKIRIGLVPLFEETFKKHLDFSKLLNGPLFVARLKEGSQQYDAYSINFTPNKILSNKKKWNKILVDGKFVRTHRLSRDTYYYVYEVKTMWNYFNENKELCIDYDTCKVLSKISIVVGGEYEKEYKDQTYYDEGFYSAEVNGLEYFAAHKFISDKEIDKLFEDEDLFKKLLQYGNKSVIEYCLNLFFKDYTIDKFFKVVEQIGL